jgi:DNA repair photolyase
LLKEIDKAAILPDDLKGKMKNGVILSVSLSTLDEKISHMLEPGAAAPLRRLEFVNELKQEGFLAGVNAIPVLPFISDTEESLEQIVSIAKQYEADYILIGGLTLFGNDTADSKTLFYKFLQRYDASLLPKYQQLYGPDFYTPFSYQDQLKERSAKICKKHNIRTSILE